MIALEYRRLSNLNPYANNPRKNAGAVDAVAASIKEFGFLVPIVVDTDGTIVAGHTRYKAAKKLGIKEVPVIVADKLTPEQVDAFRLADNKVGELAEWDEDALATELMRITGIDMTQFGFTDLPEEEPEIDPDDFDPTPAESKPVTKPGDIWRLGEHVLMCGDSTNIDDVKRLAQGKQFDLLLTDPPYNVSYEGHTADKLTIENDEMDDDAFEVFLTDAFAAADAVMRPGAVFYIYHADGNGLNFRQAIKNVGWPLRACLIWVKNILVVGYQDYKWKHEPILYGWKPGAAHQWYGGHDKRTTLTAIDVDKLKTRNKQALLKYIDELSLGVYDSHFIDSSIIYEDKPVRNKEHPTMKPVKLLMRNIENSSKAGDYVLDLFAGSGSTLIACEQLGRICHTMELDPKYCDVVIRRYEELTGNKAVLIT